MEHRGGFYGISSNTRRCDFKLYANNNKLKETEKEEISSRKKSIGSPLILPVLSFIVGCAGVCFQIFVLYPWHEELSKSRIIDKK